MNLIAFLLGSMFGGIATIILLAILSVNKEDDE